MRLDTIIIKLKMELKIALFSKFQYFNTVVLTKILLQCAIFLCYGSIHRK